MACAAKLVSATLAGAGNLAFMVAFAWGFAYAESLALPEDVAMLNNWQSIVVACSILLFGAFLHIVAFSLGADHAVARSKAPRRENDPSPKTR